MKQYWAGVLGDHNQKASTSTIHRALTLQSTGLVTSHCYLHAFLKIITLRLSLFYLIIILIYHLNSKDSVSVYGVIIAKGKILPNRTKALDYNN